MSQAAHAVINTIPGIIKKSYPFPFQLTVEDRIVAVGTSPEAMKGAARLFGFMVVIQELE